MTSKFYATDLNIPNTIKSVIESVKIYICDLLYSSVATPGRYDKFLLADIEAGSEFIIRKSIEQFKLVSGKFPFTAYNIGEIIQKTEGTNFYEKSGTYYENTYNTSVSSIPIEFELLMISLFTSPADYIYASTLLAKSNGTLTRLVVPILINNQTDYFYCDVKFEISKGALAFQYEQYEQFGRIYDIVHTAKISMRYYKFSTATVGQVDDVIFALQQYYKLGEASPVSFEHTHLSEQPVVNTIVPANGATGVSKTSTIIITFNVMMDESSTSSSISIYPKVEYDESWNNTSTVLTLTPINPLASLTLYTITIKDTSLSYWKNNLYQEYNYTFTTVV